MPNFVLRYLLEHSLWESFKSNIYPLQNCFKEGWWEKWISGVGERAWSLVGRKVGGGVMGTGREEIYDQNILNENAIFQ